MKRKFYPQYRIGSMTKSASGEQWPRWDKHEFAKAIVVGNLAFLSGVAVEKGEVPSGDVLEQTGVVVAKINSALKDIGLSLENLVKHTIYVKHGEDALAVANKFHDECYRYAPRLREEPDAGTLIYVPALSLDEMKVEIDVIAAYTDSE